MPFLRKAEQQDGKEPSFFLSQEIQGIINGILEVVPMVLRRIFHNRNEPEGDQLRMFHDLYWLLHDFGKELRPLHDITRTQLRMLSRQLLETIESQYPLQDKGIDVGISD